MATRTNRIGTLFSIAWSGHSEPPRGVRVLAWMFVPGHDTRTPDAIANYPHSLGGGYMLTIQSVHKPTQPLPQATLANVRRKRLQRRAEKKTPLLVDWYVEQQMKRKEDFYNGITDEHLQKDRDEALAREHAMLAEMLVQPNTLVIVAAEPPEATARAAQLRAEMEALRNRKQVMA